MGGSDRHCRRKLAASGAGRRRLLLLECFRPPRFAGLHLDLRPRDMVGLSLLLRARDVGCGRLLPPAPDSHAAGRGARHAGLPESRTACCGGQCAPLRPSGAAVSVGSRAGHWPGGGARRRRRRSSRGPCLFACGPGLLPLRRRHGRREISRGRGLADHQRGGRLVRESGEPDRSGI